LKPGVVTAPAILSIPAELGRLAAVRAFVRDRLTAIELDQAALADIVQAVDECVTNVIVHGYVGRVGEVEVELEAGDRSVVVRVRDAAVAFDPTMVPPPGPNRSLEDRLHGGMGVALMRASVDELHHRLLPDGRNELTMIRRIDAAE
jgi:anti-sigma regulatory factor (Ser/Thr protein kinase)